MDLQEVAREIFTLANSEMDCMEWELDLEVTIENYSLI